MLELRALELIHPVCGRRLDCRRGISLSGPDSGRAEEGGEHDRCPHRQPHGPCGARLLESNEVLHGLPFGVVDLLCAKDTGERRVFPQRWSRPRGAGRTCGRAWNKFGRSGVIKSVRFSALFTRFRPPPAAALSIWRRTRELACPREAPYSPSAGLPEGAARRHSPLGATFRLPCR